MLPPATSWWTRAPTRVPASLIILLLDHRGAHTAHRMRWAEHVYSLWLPPDGPEPTPIERGWPDLQDDRAWQLFTDRDAHQA